MACKGGARAERALLAKSSPMSSCMRYGATPTGKLCRQNPEPLLPVRAQTTYTVAKLSGLARLRREGQQFSGGLVWLAALQKPTKRAIEPRPRALTR